MKLYLLRHEKRDIRNPTFYSTLLKSGLEDAEKLKFILEKINIDLIFSSPFIRVLQTIKPYCDMKNMNVNIEYSLYEQIANHINVDYYFDENNFQIDLENNNELFYLKEPNYKSFLQLDNIEFTNDTIKRSTNFFNYIINKYKDTDHNILISSHAGIIAEMVNFDPKLWPMGGLCHVYEDNKYFFKPINF